MFKNEITVIRKSKHIKQMKYEIITQSIGIAMLPNLSGIYANNDIPGYKKLFTSGLRYILLLAIPVFAACVTLNELIMRTLFFNSSRMTEADVALTASILAFYSSALITQSINTILTRAFYACNETKTPMLTGLSIICLNILLSVLFYYYTGIGVRGMALTYAISSLVNTVLLVFLLNRKVPSLNALGGLRAYLAKTGGAALAMSAALIMLNRLLPAGFVAGPFSLSLKLRQVLLLDANTAVGALIYFGLLVLFRLPEISVIMGNIKKRLRLY